jgi:hypothetical protein
VAQFSMQIYTVMAIEAQAVSLNAKNYRIVGVA